MTLHNLGFDETGRLVLRYLPTNDYKTDFDIKDFLDIAEFQRPITQDNLLVFIFPKTSNKVKLSNTAKSVIRVFEKEFGSDVLQVDDDVKKIIMEKDVEHDLYEIALQKGHEVKQKSSHEFKPSSIFKRTLKDFQKGPVEHLLAVNNGANFSVPGSGKTTMTFAAVANWLENKIVDKIMVVGPTASFSPWVEEYEACFGKPPRFCIIKGDISNVLTKIGDSFDLFLVHFSTAHFKRDDLMEFLNKFKTVLIVDESHNIKNPDQGKWATALLSLAPFAKRRIILSGTPMPNDARDLWNQITFLWPQNNPLGYQIPFNDYVRKRGLSNNHRKILDALFSRIKKDDLGLPRPDFKIVPVELGLHQRQIYDIIAAKTLEDIESLEENAKLHKFRMAKMIRLLQTASNPSLIHEMSHEFDVNNPLFDSPEEQVSAEFGFNVPVMNVNDISKLSVYEKIKNYSKLELPSKLVEAASIAKDLVNKGEKVIIWNSFLLNMDIFKNELLPDLDPLLVNGRISSKPDVHPNRDDLVNKFKNDPDAKILIANPASLGESVSLHKNLKGETVCKNAIYLDRNYNGAQFMQSVDRIHRIGMDENVKVSYYLLVGNDTIDKKIHERLQEKWEDMTNALNDPFLKEIDFNVLDEHLNDFDKDYNSLVDHLRELKRKRNVS